MGALVFTLKKTKLKAAYTKFKKTKLKAAYTKFIAAYTKLKAAH